MPVTLEQALDFVMPDGKRLGDCAGKELDVMEQEGAEVQALINSLTDEQWEALQADPEWQQRKYVRNRFEEAMWTIGLAIAAVENYPQQDPSTTVEQVVRIALARRGD